MPIPMNRRRRTCRQRHAAYSLPGQMIGVEVLDQVQRITLALEVIIDALKLCRTTMLCAAGDDFVTRQPMCCGYAVIKSTLGMMLDGLCNKRQAQEGVFQFRGYEFV